MDRKKDMVITGGYNIYPTEVESALFEYPKVKEVAVTGIPDERLSESVKAFVVAKEGEKAREEEIIAFCREFLQLIRSFVSLNFAKICPNS